MSTSSHDSVPSKLPMVTSKRFDDVLLPWLTGVVEKRTFCLRDNMPFVVANGDML